MHHILPLSAALAAALLLGGCQPSEPEPTCRQSVRVSERHGQQVIQAVNGLYLRADFPISGCEARPYSKDPKARHFVRSGSLDYYWWKGALYDGREHAQLVRAGALTAQESILIQGGIGFHENEDDPARAFLKPRAWWYQPAIPHQHYPIDLLPNFGLDAPDIDKIYQAISQRLFQYTVE